MMAALAAPPATLGRTLDRVVASVGNTAITESDVNDEYHFELFLEGRVPAGDPSPANRHVILDRLISRTLLFQELKRSGERDAPSDEDATRTLQEIKKRFLNPVQYDSAVKSLGMTQAQIVKRLVTYQQTLRFIDERFRPLQPPTPAEIKAYYQTTLVPEYAKVHASAPPLTSEVEAQIREILLQKQIDQRLDQWLAQMRSTERARIHSDGRQRE